ncbi:hypothetical protein HY413_01040, partial [Candidatus Kaiserbacteria bacterium]|nr:hypothetical protein [Candidatus Kaiserbacteria bacterium]
LCFFTTDKKLNKAHVKYLEELLIKEAGEAGRVHLQNNNQSQQTGLSESEEEATLLFAENIKRILASVGYTFLKKSTEYEEGSGDVYICRGPNAEARALYTTEGIVVREGSLARKEFVPSADRIERLQIKQRELGEV